jgi:Xaa-Pro aminopeptidase
MDITKRQLIGAGGLVALAACSPSVTEKPTLNTAQEPANSLKSLTGNVPVINAKDHAARIAKAQSLMRKAGIGALILEAGASLQYFTGIRWWRSERLTAAVIPADGEIGIVTPHFEEPSIRESMKVGQDVRVWNEHESPFELLAGILSDRGLSMGKIAFEDTVRYFAVDGFQKAAPNYEVVNGAGVVWGCRMIKSAKEISLLQSANDITQAAYRYTHPKIEVGMTPADIRTIMQAATEALGGSNEFSMVLLNEASAYPHGSATPQTVREGSTVLMDCGANFKGYKSDMSRTFVFGEPSKKQSKVWNLVRDGQALAFETAQIGTPAGQVDDAVRKLYESEGFGPGYKLPGLPHRTGHGIGLDGHEQANFVHGEQTKLAPGMCLSNEPGLYIMGEFGVRFEDCLYMTDTGPKYFTEPPRSLDAPV